MSKITIEGKDIEVQEKEMLQQDLLFDVNNPRVYTALRENGNDNPSQSEIETKMRSLEHVKELKQQIEQNGGLIEAIIVIKREEGYVVKEGNSRLAAYRILAQGDPHKWAKIRVNVLPENTSEDDIDVLLGTYHLTPKKDWSKYERAAYIHRMKQRDDAPDKTIAKKTGLSVHLVKKHLKIYRFMVEHNDTVQSHYDCYEQYIGSNKFDKYRDVIPEIDDVVTKQIKSGKLQAHDIRDKLSKIAKATDKTSNRIMKAYIKEEVDANGAYARFEATGRSGNNYKKLQEFRSLVSSDDFIKAVETEAIQNNGIHFEIKKIQHYINKILKDIEKDL